jgi:Cu(I)/Ag(I) efflux system membrane fusion protein
MEVQRALSTDDARASKRGFKKLSTVDEIPGLQAAARNGAAAQDLAGQRRVFLDVTMIMITHLRTRANPLNQPIDLAECPMAFSGKGAQWLQTDKLIANPYFGSEMQRCGSFKAAAKPGETLSD